MDAELRERLVALLVEAAAQSQLASAGVPLAKAMDAARLEQVSAAKWEQVWVARLELVSAGELEQVSAARLEPVSVGELEQVWLGLA